MTCHFFVIHLTDKKHLLQEFVLILLIMIGKVMLVIMNVLFGLPAVMTWAAFGTVLRRAFTTPRSATLLNRGMGVSLFAVALWIVIPPDYYSNLLG